MSAVMWLHLIAPQKSGMKLGKLPSAHLRSRENEFSVMALLILTPNLFFPWPATVCSSRDNHCTLGATVAKHVLRYTPTKAIHWDPVLHLHIVTNPFAVTLTGRPPLSVLNCIKQILVSKYPQR